MKDNLEKRGGEWGVVTFSEGKKANRHSRAKGLRGRVGKSEVGLYSKGV